MVHTILHALVGFFFAVGLVTSSFSLFFMYLSRRLKRRTKLAEEQRVIEQDVEDIASRYNQAAMEVAVLELWLSFDDTRVEDMN